jgi:hypothetical protein
MALKVTHNLWAFNMLYAKAMIFRDVSGKHHTQEAHRGRHVHRPDEAHSHSHRHIDVIMIDATSSTTRYSCIHEDCNNLQFTHL